jgi:putative ABC transport system permease protein
MANTIEQFGRDVRFSVRVLLRNPGLTLVLLLTLAVGIGGTTAIFSIVDALLIQPLPFAHPDRLMAVFQTKADEGVLDAGTSYPNFLDWRQQKQALEEIAALRQRTFTLTGAGDPIYLNAASVSSGFFRLFGVNAIKGRTFSPEDDTLNANPVVLVSETLWREQFGAREGIIGEKIELDHQPYTLAGILPANFNFPYNNPPVQLWIPLFKDPDFPGMMERRRGHYLDLVASLKPGVSRNQGEAELAVIVARLAKEYPEANSGWGIRLVPLQEQLVGNVKTPLLLLWAAVILVLVIAATNVTNLLLARASARLKEQSLRIALGAKRSALIQQLFTESLILGLAGGALGCLLAFICVKSFATVIPDEIPLIRQIRVDGRVLWFCLGVSTLTGILIGLLPAFFFTGRDLREHLQEGGRSGTGRRGLWMRRVLVVAEIAVATILAIGSGLLLRSFERLQHVTLGFEPAGVLTANVALPRFQYTTPQQWIAFFRQVTADLQHAPGVQQAAAALPLPPLGSGLNFGFHIPGRAAKETENYSANYGAVSPEYFQLLRIPLLEGRLFTDADAENAPKVCLVSREFVRRYFQGEDPLGRQLIFGYQDEVPRQIVGVVGDVKQVGLVEPFSPQMYVPYPQNPWWSMGLLLKTTGSLTSLEPLVRNEIQHLDAGLPVTAIQPLSQAIGDDIAQPRFRTWLFGLFAATALFLAALGTYGVISYFVVQGTRDIGVRMALGAVPKKVLLMVIGQGLKLALSGIAAGLIAALILHRVIASILFEISAVDLLTLSVTVALLALVSFAACYIPARRAMRVDPMSALRHE